MTWTVTFPTTLSTIQKLQFSPKLGRSWTGSQTNSLFYPHVCTVERSLLTILTTTSHKVAMHFLSFYTLKCFVMIFQCFDSLWISGTPSVGPSSCALTADGYCCNNIFSLNSVHEWPPPFPQIDIIGAMVIVWRVRGKIIRSVLCNIVRNNCAQCNAHTYEQT